MPELSRFFGIVIRMFVEVGAPHHRPHCHAVYQDTSGVFSLDPVDWIVSDLPEVQRHLVEKWAELHHDELIEVWTRLQSGRAPFKIDPLQ